MVLPRLSATNDNAGPLIDVALKYALLSPVSKGIPTLLLPLAKKFPADTLPLTKTDPVTVNDPVIKADPVKGNVVFGAQDALAANCT